MARIFISYRRVDEPGSAGRLFDQLENVFTRDFLFMDVDSIAAGLDFVRTLAVKVEQCDVLLAVVGKGWVDARDKNGSRRLDDPNDFVRIEIDTGLKQGKRVIPILVNNAEMPSADELPGPLKLFARCNAMQLRHERFKADVQGLIAQIRVALRDADVARAEGIKRAPTEIAPGQKTVALPPGPATLFKLIEHPEKRVGFIPGPLDAVSNVDVWVNSENDQFEMARIYERSVSSTIRYLGSTTRQVDGMTVFGDEVAIDLRRAKALLFPGKSYVREGTAVLTPPRALAHHNVRMIAHVASITGLPGRGFRLARDIGSCIRNVLKKIEAYNQGWFRRTKLRSVIFPLLGAAGHEDRPDMIVDQQLWTAIDHLSASRDNHLTAIYFIAYTDYHRELLESCLQKFREVQAVSAT